MMTLLGEGLESKSIGRCHDEIVLCLIVLITLYFSFSLCSAHARVRGVSTVLRLVRTSKDRPHHHFDNRRVRPQSYTHAHGYKYYRKTYLARPQWGK